MDEIDRGKVIEGLEAIREFFRFGLPSQATVFEVYQNILTDTITLLKEHEEEQRQLLSWLGKFCRHIDNGDAWLTDEENIAFFKKKMKQQFGWDTD